MAFLIDYNERIFILYINSENRISGSVTDFIIQYDAIPQMQFDRMVMLQAQIPKSYYAVLTDAPGTRGVQTFELSEDGGLTWHDIVVPTGNYNVNGFAAVVTNLLNSGGRSGYTIGYPNIQTQTDTGMYTFTTTVVPATNVKFRFTYTYPGIYQLMGFTVPSTSPTTTYTFTSGGTLTSNAIINMQPIKDVYVTCDSVNDGVSNILQVIPNQSFPTMSSVQFFQRDFQLWSRPYIPTLNNQFHFQVTDQFARPLNLNGLDWSCQVALYVKEDILERSKAFLSYHREENFNDTLKMFANDMSSQLSNINQTVGVIARTAIGKSKKQDDVSMETALFILIKKLDALTQKLDTLISE